MIILVLRLYLLEIETQIAEGVEGMSASKMRKAAADNDFKTYRSGIPTNIDDKTAKVMMNTLTKEDAS